MLFGIPLDFILFAVTLVGVALFHHHTLQVALTGLATIALYKILFIGFKFGPGFTGFIGHLGHEWVILSNLLCLLMGFALLSDHFEKSHLPELLPKYLSSGWPGAFALLVMIFILSSFLDNIAAAIIGGTVAAIVFNKRVHIGYLAAIVAASNAGGSGSVVGDTTTTMMWIAGVNPVQVFPAYVAAGVALFVFGIPASIQQFRYQPLIPATSVHDKVDGVRLAIVFFILALAIVANVLANVVFVGLADHWPVLGIAVWVALLLSAPLRQPNWGLMPETFKGSIFLLSLVMCASLMPVEKLPPASWQSAFTLGFVSSVFDNIPLTALAISQGGYDWGMLAYCVGFGGSMIWFGSSAGVAISNIFPEAKSVGAWVKNGWHIALAYVVGFAVMMLTVGWNAVPK
ncbi:MAG: citrate transporter [Magnetococcales bacterium]|nr:citrate transporter [Magnetococcales bacterium]NGZ25610.1 citrate transporter [Magnetococcales bacterium]